MLTKEESDYEAYARRLAEKQRRERAYNILVWLIVALVAALFVSSWTGGIAYKRAHDPHLGPYTECMEEMKKLRFGDLKGPPLPEGLPDSVLRDPVPRGLACQICADRAHWFEQYVECYDTPSIP
jgi:hypothetical protein